MSPRSCLVALALSVASACASPSPPRAPADGAPPPASPPSAAQASAPPSAAPSSPPPIAHDGAIPEPVATALATYLHVLRTSATVDECAARFTPLAGGGLVSEDGRALRQDVPRFSLKKDFESVRFYADPPRITRVEVRKGQSDGYGASALRGTLYRIWVAKAQGQPGMPAPVAILDPEPHPFVRGPRVVGVGSL